MLPPVDEPEEAKFAMAPMIDMVFLLLVFFMCASHLNSLKNLEIEIPKATKGVIPKDRPDRWVVNIKKDGSVYSGDQPVTIEQLKGLVTARLKEKADTKVYVRADASAQHRQVKNVMNAMAQAGVDDFIFGVFGEKAEGGAP
jgi:biopolymer transport protein ExbD